VIDSERFSLVSSDWTWLRFDADIFALVSKEATFPALG
jgi:hypothetical protein